MPNTEQYNKKKVQKKIIYRVSILNDQTHERLFGIRGRKSQLIAIISAVILLYTGIIVAIIALTPIKKLLPGYPDANVTSLIYNTREKEEEIIKEMTAWNLYMANIERLMSGEAPLAKEQITKYIDSTYKVSENYTHSRADSLLREEVRSGSIVTGASGSISDDISDLKFFRPVSGVISARYNMAANHPFLDIATTENSVVSATLPGTIISDEYTDQYGYTIKIQHAHDLISVYRHNSKVLKKRGDKVNAGTAIAIVGKNGGTESTGPHLHFELWHNGNPVNPELYINF